MQSQQADPALQIFDTLSKSKRDFTPTKPGEISMYQCGPTVYWNQHIGNMRAMVMSDLIRRSLQFLYPDSQVRFVRNYTDVGHLSGDNEGDADTGVDRMQKGAEREGVTPDEIAQKYITQFESDVAQLNCLPPDATPRATEYIPEMRDMVQTLLNAGYAYATPLAIYFDISQKSDYTKLSRQDMTKLINDSGHGDISDNEKKNPGDFSLWFFRTGTHAQALQHWESPTFTGRTPDQERGFPGWHIECSAMIRKILGSTIDIHMGGIEHISIHHTNEIAQSETMNHCCDADAPFVGFWIHNEHLNVDGGKMSKSAGTSYVLQDIINKGFSPLDLRYFFLQAHYRSKQNFTWEALEASKTARERLVQKMKNTYADTRHHKNNENILDGMTLQQDQIDTWIMHAKTALANDFNIPSVLSCIYDVLDFKVSELNEANILKVVFEIDNVLGLNLKNEIEIISEFPNQVYLLADQRAAAKSEKNWAESDRLRNEISALGYEIKDTSDGNYELSKK